MRDKILKRERRMNPGNVVKRVKSHGYGKNDKYRDKPKVVCYSILYEDEHHSFVTYEKGKFRKFIANLTWYIRYQLRRVL